MIFREYKVNGLFRVGKTKYPQGVVFSWGENGMDLTYYFNRPSEKEIKSFQKGKYQFAITSYRSVLFFLSKLGEMNWTDAPYSVNLANSFEIEPINDTYLGYALNMYLVDASTGLLKGMRLVGLDNSFSKKLRGLVLEQLDLNFDKESYAANLSEIYRVFPTNKLLQMSIAKISGN